MKLTKQEILAAINEYRQQPLVQDRHGPTSLGQLSDYLYLQYDKTIVPGSLSLRINELVDLGYLSATRDWTCPKCGKSNVDYGAPALVCRGCTRHITGEVGFRIYTFSLRLTDGGQRYIVENGDGTDPD